MISFLIKCIIIVWESHKMEERQKLSEVFLIAKDDHGEARCINLSGLKVELVIPAPKADGGTADLKRLLSEAREGLEFYADQAGYARKGRRKSKIDADGGDVARDTLAAVKYADSE